MTKKELIIKLFNVPDDAEIFVEADHGQQPSQADYIDISSTPRKYWEYPYEDIDWRGNEKAITAVRIS